MTTSLTPPTEDTAKPSRRGLRTFLPQLSETHPLRRLGQIAELFPLLPVGPVLFLGQTREDIMPLSSMTILLFLLLGMAFLLHLHRESQERIAEYDRQEAERLALQAAPPTVPAQHRRGRPPAIPSGHSAEAARLKSRQLHELRAKGVTWKEAARQVDLTMKQAQNLYKHAPHLSDEHDQ